MTSDTPFVTPKHIFRQRKSPRLQGYDYSQSGAYFVTICTSKRDHLFGQVADDEVVLTAAGEIAFTSWLDLPNHHQDIELDLFVIMPDHIHGIVMILDQDVSAGYADAVSVKGQPKAGTLSVVIGSYKSAVTRKIRTLTGHSNQTVWQSRFHDHIIRDEHSLNILRQYVLCNPARWNKDVFFGC